MLRTLGSSDFLDDTRLAALREAVDVAEASIAAGRVDGVPADGMRDYVGRIGQEAIAIAGTKTE